MKKITLSKSSYLEGLRCPRLLWLRINRPELTEPLDAQTQYLFQTGHRVEEFARTLAQGGQLIGNGEAMSFADLLAATESAFQSKSPILYEAAFASGSMHCRTDILERIKGSRRWNLGEIKMCTKLKPEHVDDVAFQVCCMGEASHKVNRAYLIHINNGYIRQGEIDPKKLFAAEEITNEVVAEAQNVPGKVLDLVLQVQKPVPPTVIVGSRCNDPGRCPFYQFCHDSIPQGSIFELPYGNKAISTLLALGIERLVDIPHGFPLSPRQALLVQSAKSGEPIIDAYAIREFLKQLRYPLHLLDFETGNFCIPPFDGTSPYERMPFQYSLHVQQARNGSLQHFEFLPESPCDPRLPLSETLMDLIGDRGSILAWNASFEKSVLTRLAERFPQYSDRIHSILDRVVDLIVPFRSGAYCDFRCRGSASLKKVLPVLAPQLSYSGLSVQKGDEASLLYQRYIENDMTGAEWAAVRPDLLAYCGLDTVGMIAILDVLYSL